MEEKTHCAGHEKSTIAINNLENETVQLRKEADEVWKRIQHFLTVGSFRWTVSGLVFIVCLAIGANWKQQNSMDTKLDTITNKLSFFEGQASSGKTRTPGIVKQISL
jgi:hypothetical protein